MKLCLMKMQLTITNRKKYVPVILLSLFVYLNTSLSGHSQPKNLPKADTSISKWLRASLNLEARPNFFESKIWFQWQDSMRKGKSIERETALKIQSDYSKIKYTATGIFFFYQNKHYIVTARHFLADDNAVFKNTVIGRIFLIDNGSNDIKGKDSNYNLTPDVHYLDGYNSGKKGNDVKYILSDKKVDIAIIALDDIPKMGRQFVAFLYRRGYRPIQVSDIDTTNKLVRNGKMFAIGFPSELARLNDQTKNYDSSVYYWQSPFVTIPVLSSGHIKDPCDGKIYFTGNIFIYHGFSGGPAISHNKLIGISDAYGGDTVNTQSSNLNYYRDEFSLFIKASNIFPLIRELAKRFSPIAQPFIINENYKDSLTTIIRIGQK